VGVRRAIGYYEQHIVITREIGDIFSAATRASICVLLLQQGRCVKQQRCAAGKSSPRSMTGDMLRAKSYWLNPFTKAEIAPLDKNLTEIGFFL
jgi:hypothetical protein